MDSKNASVSVRDGAVEVAGSEEFVAAQLEKLRPWLDKMLHETPREVPAIRRVAASPTPASVPAVGSGNGGDVGRFENVLHVEDGRVNVLQLPGGSKKSELAVAAALIYIWAKTQNGTPDVAFAEIRQVCKQHGCLDESNFASHLKSAKTDLIISGSGKSQTARLTVPGQRHALALIEQLNNPE